MSVFVSFFVKNVSLSVFFLFKIGNKSFNQINIVYTRPKVIKVSGLVSKFSMFRFSDCAKTFFVGFSYLLNTKMTIDKKVCESVTQK